MLLIKDYFSGIYKDRYVLATLVGSDLRMKYRNSLLGVGWSVLVPFGLALIIGGVHSIIFGMNPVEFIPMLFSGLNPWLFISTSADGGTSAFLGAEGYLKQTSVKAQIFPLRVVLVNFVNLLYALSAFVVFYLFMQPHMFGPSMLMVVPGLLIIFVFGVGMAGFSSVVHLNIRDYQPFQSIILQGMFFATPIIFPASMLRDRGFSLVYQLNPFHYMIEVVRAPLLGRELPSVRVYLVAVFIAVSFFLFGMFLVMRARKNIVYKL